MTIPSRCCRFRRRDFNDSTLLRNALAPSRIFPLPVLLKLVFSNLSDGSICLLAHTGFVAMVLTSFCICLKFSVIIDYFKCK